MAANSSDDREDWLNTLHELTRTATDRIHILRTREKNLRIASELSNLVVYCQAVPFNPQFASKCFKVELGERTNTLHSMRCYDIGEHLMVLSSVHRHSHKISIQFGLS